MRNLTYRVYWFLLLFCLFGTHAALSQTTSSWFRHQGVTFNVTPYYGIMKKMLDGVEHPGIKLERWAFQIDGTVGVEYRGKKYFPSDFNGALRAAFNDIKVKGINGSADLNVGSQGQVRDKGFVTFFDLGMYGTSYTVLASVRKNEDVTITRINITGGQLLGVEDLWRKIDELEEKEKAGRKQKENEERERLKREAENRAASAAASKATTKPASENNTGGTAAGKATTQPTGGKTTSTTKPNPGSNENATKSPNAPDRSKLPKYARDADGNYFEKDENNNYSPISREAYETGKRGQSQANTQAQAQAKKVADQQFADSVINSLTASSERLFENNRTAQAQSNQQWELMSKNFYTAQLVRDAKSNFQDQSKLANRYNSVEELEQDYRQKSGSLSATANQLADAKNQNLQSNYEYQFRDADATGRAMGQAVVGMGSLINNISAERQAEKARRDLAAARDAQLKKMEEARWAAILEARKKLLLDFPDGGTPMSFHRVAAGEVYLFAYSTNPRQLEEKSPVLLVSNVFPIGKRSDGTWPFKSSITAELNRLMQGQSTILFGYFDNKAKANEWNAAFKRIALQSALVIQPIQYAGKPATVKSVEAAGPSEQTTDFFGNPLPGAINKQKPQLEKSKPKYDFFGNPIKE